MTDLGLPFSVRSEDGLLYEVGVYAMTFETIQHLWKRFLKHRVLLADFAVDDPKIFFRMILARDTVILKVSDVGIVYATGLIPGYYARAHYFFWDRVSEGRHKVVLHSLKWAIEAFDLQRVDIEIPRYAYAALHRVHKIGFRLEGIKRASILHKEQWHDLFQFGMLRSELTDRALETGYLERIGDERGWFGLLKKDMALMNYIMEKVK